MGITLERANRDIGILKKVNVVYETVDDNRTISTTLIDGFISPSITIDGPDRDIWVTCYVPLSCTTSKMRTQVYYSIDNGVSWIFLGDTGHKLAGVNDALTVYDIFSAEFPIYNVPKGTLLLKYMHHCSTASGGYISRAQLNYTSTFIVKQYASTTNTIFSSKTRKYLETDNGILYKIHHLINGTSLAVPNGSSEEQSTTYLTFPSINKSQSTNLLCSLNIPIIRSTYGNNNITGYKLKIQYSINGGAYITHGYTNLTGFNRLNYAKQTQCFIYLTNLAGTNITFRIGIWDNSSLSSAFSVNSFPSEITLTQPLSANLTIWEIEE